MGSKHQWWGLLLLLSIIINNYLFIYFASKITADGDCSHEIKRRLLLGSKVVTSLDSILKTETLLCQQRSVSSKLWFFQ